jgi:hypothetical protein
MHVHSTPISMSGLCPPWHPAGHPNSILLHCHPGHRQLSPPHSQQAPASAQGLAAQSIIATFHLHLLAGQHAHQVLLAWASYTQRARRQRLLTGHGMDTHKVKEGCPSNVRGYTLESAQVMAERLRSARLAWSALCSWRWFVRLQVSERLACQHATLQLLSRSWEVC